MRRALLGHSALIVIAVVLLAGSQIAEAASHRSANFIVEASSPEIAEKVAKCAEYWRVELATAWFGAELPNWSYPCSIQVRVGQIPASGQTTFTFQDGHVHSWQMEVNGTLERVLDSVVPHEVNHTIFASHFRRPLPRWADEGAATLFEHASEQNIQKQLLLEVIQTPKKIPLRTLFNIREYPSDQRDVLTLYAEGFSLATFLVGLKGPEGRKIYLQLLQDAHQTNWEAAIVKNYGFRSIDELEQVWTNWVLNGSRPLEPQGTAVASNDSRRNPDGTVFRSQSPEAEATAKAATSAPVNSLVSVPQTNTVGTLPLTTRELRNAGQDFLEQAETFNFQPKHQRNPSTQASAKSEPQRIAQEDRNDTRFVPTRDEYRTQVNGPQYSYPSARRQ